MKLDSKYFDKIRVKPGEDRTRRETVAPCEWPGCPNAGAHKAPKGRNLEGQYHRFCTTHVQQYNKSYNFFDGMGDDAVAGFMKDARTGHRPTWKLGENAAAVNGDENKPTSGGRRRRGATTTRDPFGLFTDEDRAAAAAATAKRKARNAEVKALGTLGLDENATPEQAKAQYKTLVKRLHPDANGGSRASEDTFRAVIQAFDYLRSTGFC